MTTALALVAALVGLLALLLLVPVEFAGRVRGIAPWQGQVAIRWLFGLARLRLQLPRAEAPPGRSAGGRRTTRRRSRGRRPRRGPDSATRGGSGAKALAVLRQPDFRARLWRLVRDLDRATRMRDLALHLRVGLGDPADTGLLWGLLAPFGIAARHVQGADLRIEPDFIDETLDFEARGRIVLVPLRLLGLGIAFALSPASLRAWRTLRTA